MQPLFRQSTSSDLPLPIYSGVTTFGDPWGQVRKFGTTGLSCLLTMMSWWGSATLTPSLWNDDPKPLWEGVVNDLDKVLDALVATPPPLKRPLDDVDAAGDKENKRCVFHSVSSLPTSLISTQTSYPIVSPCAQ
jgi:hypothetical protein